MEGVCGGKDAHCVCDGNETMVGGGRVGVARGGYGLKNDRSGSPAQGSREDALSKVGMGY